jgi:Mrp family chromosome partitioning ATPase
MDTPRPVSYDMSHYFSLLRRHWWIIALLTAAGIVGALGVARTQPKVYESTTSVLVIPTSSTSTTVSGGRTSGTINLDTEAQLVTSATVATDAAKLLKVTTPPAVLAAQISVTVPANTSVMSISAAASTPLAAQASSHAFATAYLANRQSSAQADLSSQVSAINTTIQRQQSSLTRINDDLAKLVPGSAKYANEQSQRQTLTSQINSLTNRMNNLSTTTVTSGSIITDAALPTKPSKPSVPLFLTSGAMLGILVGLALAILRQQSDQKIRFAADVPRRSGLPLLAQLPVRVKPRFDDVFPPYGTGGRTFNRLRNEVLASSRENDQIIVVTGASKGSASSLVSANLASALARAGSEVVLISAHLPESMAEAAPLTRMLGVVATPGLSDVLAGKVPLETATQRAPRNPWLRVITTGGTASATGFLQSQTLRDILTQLRAQAEYIVIEAPSTSNSADAQSLASFADVAIVVVELRRTTHGEVLDAADQLRRITTSMVGCVVLPKLKRGGGDDVPAPPPPGRPLATPIAPREGVYIESLPTAPIRMARDSVGAPPVERRDRRVDTAGDAHVIAVANGTPAQARAAEPDPARIGTAAEAAAATSAAGSGMADSFFGDDYAIETTAPNTRRRILPTRRGILRNLPPRWPSPLRPNGSHPDASPAPESTLDAPLTTAAGGAAQMSTGGSRRRGVPTVSVPETSINQPPINPTNIIDPVVGATSVVVKPSEPTPSRVEATPSSAPIAESMAVKPRDAGGDASVEVGKAIGSKSVPGTKVAGDPLVGGSGDTVTFQRIDLVYVEDGDGDGTTR